MMAESGIRMQKQIAMGGDMPSGNFGVVDMQTMAKGGPAVPAGDAMKDRDRGAPPPIKHTRGQMPAQANADHGPHNHK